MSCNPVHEGAQALQGRMEAIMEEVRRLKAGGDLEGLLEEKAAELKLLLYEAAAHERRQAAARTPADFPPSGLSSVRPRDARGGGSIAPGPHAGRKAPV